MIVRKKFTFEAAHRLLKHSGRCAGIHGHSYKVEVVVGGRLEPFTGMVADFGEIKKALEPFIDQFDHTLMVSTYDYLLRPDVLVELNPRYIITPYEPTAEMMAAHIYWYAKTKLDPLSVVKVRVWETETGWAECDSVVECAFIDTIYSDACRMMVVVE